MINDWRPDICIYHFPCDDGFTAAWTVWRQWGDDVDFRPANHGGKTPDREIEGKDVLITDFSFGADELAAMGERARSIIVLDHHKAAATELARFLPKDGVSGLILPGAPENWPAVWKTDGGNVLAWIDPEKSAARMTWDFCFPKEPMPGLIKHIEDRDLWRYQLPETRALSLFLRSYPYEFRAWSGIMHQFDSAPASVISEAGAIKRFQDLKIAEILPTAVMNTIGPYEGVPVVHANGCFTAEVAHALLAMFPRAPLVAVISHDRGARTYTLRSEDRRADVSALARRFGGGGHRNAAEFQIPE